MKRLLAVGNSTFHVVPTHSGYEVRNRAQQPVAGPFEFMTLAVLWMLVQENTCAEA